MRPSAAREAETVVDHALSHALRQSPFALLQALEARAIRNAAGLPKQQAQVEQWVGILFRLGEMSLVAPMSEAVEIMRPPEYVRIPGVKPWTLGIANVRGSLLPLFDLQAFLFDQQPELGKTHRVLVVSYRHLFAGLVLTGVSGLRYFDTRDRVPESPHNLDPAVSRYVVGAFREGASYWPIFSPFRLVQSAEFFQVAR